MSGGSMNYLYAKIENDSEFSLTTPERAAFKKHLQKVAKALHDIEWVDSCDYSPGEETEAIMACISTTDVLADLIEQGEKIAQKITELLKASQ